MSTQAELAAQLSAVADQADKAKAEILAEVGNLQTQVASLEAALAAAGTTTPEVDAALARVKASVQVLDDLNPDAPVTP